MFKYSLLKFYLLSQMFRIIIFLFNRYKYFTITVLLVEFKKRIRALSETLDVKIMV